MRRTVMVRGWPEKPPLEASLFFYERFCMKKKKLSKPRIRVKSKDNGWESVTWGATAGSKTGNYPAWRVDKTACHIDLIKGNDEGAQVLKIEKSDPKLIAHFVGRLVNKYYGERIEMTKELQVKISELVQKFITNTSDIFEKL